MARHLESTWTKSGIERGLVGSILVVTGFSLFVNVLVLTSPLYMLQIYDRVLTTGQVETLLYISVIALVAFAVYSMLDGVRGYLTNRIGIYIDRTLREVVLTQAVARARQDQQRGPSRLIEDLNVMRGYFGSGAMLALVDAPWVPFFMIVIAIIHPLLGVLAVISGLLLFLLGLTNDLLTHRSLVNAVTLQRVSSDFASSTIQNADVVQAMGMQDAVARKYRQQTDEAGQAGQHAADTGAVISAITKGLRIAVQSAALGLGAYLVIRGELTPGGMIASSIILGRALAPIEQAIGSWKQSVTARDSYLNIRRFLSSIPAATERLAQPGLHGQLRVEGLRYQPAPGQRPILNGVSFQLDPGTALALVGPSASGKSTLCRLLVGAIQPSFGNVRIDGAEIAMLNPSDISRTIGYLPQTIELFSGTIKANIARLGDVDDQAVIAAARSAGCHELILALPQSYETEVGPNGVMLSGGQRQRIGLARALYGKPRLLVLDEPNANLDQEGEIALVNAIAEAKSEGASVVVVSHRNTLLRPIDKLGIMRDGVLERFGDRDAILRQMSPRPKPSVVAVTTQAEGGKAS